MSEGRRTAGYRYKELGNCTSCIRLLTLNLENDKHFLAGTLGVFDLDKKSNYVAASYEWGERDPQADVVIDGKCLPVGYNLWLLLTELKNRMLRGALNRSARIWIDAICIDQNNVKERNEQVSVMGQIFKSATGVFAWLGLPEGWTPSRTFDFMRSRPRVNQAGRANIQVNGIQQIPSRHSYPELWAMVLRMCRCRYWSRRWVIQELLLATDVTILCGESDIAWFYLMRLLHGLDSVQWPNSGYTRTIESIKTTLPAIMSRYTTMGSESFKVIYQSDDHSLVDLATDFLATKCEVTHDKIYSLLSLAREGADVPIDYQCSPEDLVANLFTKLGWSKPEHVRTIAMDFGLAETVPYSFGGPRRGLKRTNCFVQSLTAINRITHCHSIHRGFDRKSVKYSELEHLQKLLSIKDLCTSIDFLRSSGGQYRSSGLSDFNWWVSLDPAKIAVCEDGSVAIVCRTAQPGDYICRFGGTVLVVRTMPQQCNEHQAFEVTGTACVVILNPQRSSALLQDLVTQAMGGGISGGSSFEWLIHPLQKVLPISLGGFSDREPLSPHQRDDPMPETSLSNAKNSNVISPENPEIITGAFDIWDLIEFSRKHPPEELKYSDAPSVVQ